MSKIISFVKHELVNLGKKYDAAVIGVDKYGRTVYDKDKLTDIMYEQFRQSRTTEYDGSVDDDFLAAAEYVDIRLDVGDDYVVIIEPEF